MGSSRPKCNQKGEDECEAAHSTEICLQKERIEQSWHVVSFARPKCVRSTELAKGASAKEAHTTEAMK